MNLYLNEMIAGMKEMLSLHKQGQNIFEMKGGNLFPTIDKQQMWQFARGKNHIHFTDGNKTYSFTGDLKDEDTEIEKQPDVPLPDLYKDVVSKGKAQVHRSDPGSIYFTLQEGTNNPTYTFRHTGDSKWKAIPKKRKVKEQLAQPAFIPNINVQSVKEGMVKELNAVVKRSEDGGTLDFFNRGLGKGLAGLVEGAKTVAMGPGYIGGDPATDGPMSPLLNAGLAGVGGAAGGLGYHWLRQKYYNTPEENQAEDNKTMLRRILYPGAAMAGLNFVQRNVTGPGGYYHQAAQGMTPKLIG